MIDFGLRYVLILVVRLSLVILTFDGICCSPLFVDALFDSRSKHFDFGNALHDAVGTPYAVAPEVIRGSCE